MRATSDVSVAMERLRTGSEATNGPSSVSLLLRPRNARRLLTAAEFQFIPTDFYGYIYHPETI